jgi:hypothetical protein
VNDDEELALRKLYSDPAAGTVRTSSGSQEPIKRLFDDRNIRLACADKTDFLGRVPDRPVDPHEVIPKQGQTEEQAVQEIAKNDTPTACKELTENDWPILTVLAWPEFRMILEDVTINLGCGIRIIITLPVLQLQISGKDLWVYTRYPGSWTNITSIIKQCAFEGALAGGVIGVVTLDPASALAAFLAYFQDCISTHLQQTIECMVPGLGLVDKVIDPWHDFI